MLTATMHSWRIQLGKLIDYYDWQRPRVSFFFPKLFLFFVVINFSCYWLAMATAFPKLVFGHEVIHYAKVSLPVGVLGAVFDSLSFYITLALVRRAVRSHTAFSFISHLSADFVIAVIATWWVLFVFVFSGWLINTIEGRVYHHDTLSGRRWVITAEQVEAYAAAGLIADTAPQSKGVQQLQLRRTIYLGRILRALRNPFAEWRNIYFGIVMGISAMLPTCIHLYMFGVSLFKRGQR